MGNGNGNGFGNGNGNGFGNGNGKGKGNGNGNGNGFGNGNGNGKGKKSDIRLKRDIALVGRLSNGLGLYRFRYLWSDTTYVGVMAQEVALVRSDAVARGADGYLRVDYAALGLQFQTWSEWSASTKQNELIAFTR
jgi:hypothetical protein